MRKCIKCNIESVDSRQLLCQRCKRGMSNREQQDALDSHRFSSGISDSDILLAGILLSNLSYSSYNSGNSSSYDSGNSSSYDSGNSSSYDSGSSSSSSCD